MKKTIARMAREILRVYTLRQRVSDKLLANSLTLGHRRAHAFQKTPPSLILTFPSNSLVPIVRLYRGKGRSHYEHQTVRNSSSHVFYVCGMCLASLTHRQYSSGDRSPRQQTRTGKLR